MASMALYPLRKVNNVEKRRQDKTNKKSRAKLMLRREGKDKYKTPSRKVDIAALTAFTIKEKNQRERQVRI